MDRSEPSAMARSSNSMMWGLERIVREADQFGNGYPNGRFAK